MKQYHCTICVQSKDVDKFKKWTADKSKARRCDSCQDDPEVEKRIENSKSDAKLKDIKKASATPSGEGKCKTRNSIDDILYGRRVDDEIGDKD